MQKIEGSNPFSRFPAIRGNHRVLRLASVFIGARGGLRSVITYQSDTLVQMRSSYERLIRRGALIGSSHLHSMAVMAGSLKTERLREDVGRREENAAQGSLREADIRRNLPSDLFARQPVRFAAKFWFGIALIAAGYMTIAASFSWVATAIAMVVVGLMYAHLVELQHEALHNHAFNSRRLNRAYGSVCGLFMLSSYSSYQYEHLRHHASLGKPNNREFFDYRFQYLDSVWGFIRAAFHLGRYVGVARDIGRAVTNRPILQVSHDRDRRRIANEYCLFAIGLLGMIAFTVITGSPFFILAWLVPLLLVSDPVHFFIELPEHFGLNAQADPNVLTNTRTIEAPGLAQWFTNSNNLHTAHHYHQGVPMGNVGKLSELVQERFEVVERSYWTFYRKVINGEIRYVDPDASSR